MFRVACFILLSTSVALIKSDDCQVAALGLDVAAATTQDQFTCEVQKNYQITVVKVVDTDGQATSYAKTAVNNAIQAGMAGVHYSIFGKFGSDPVAQVKAGLDATGNPPELSFSIVWIGVTAASGFGSDASANIDFLDKMIKEVQDYYKGGPNPVVGIYTNQADWKAITNNSQKYGKIWLWYAHSPSDPDCKDWNAQKPDGGWANAIMKQYKVDTQDSSCQNVKFNQNIVIQPSQDVMAMMKNVQRNGTKKL